MKRFWFAWLIAIFLALPARAHVGSPDVFFEGRIGPYPAHVSIRMPSVVPGRAQIFVRTDSAEPVEVSFRPLFAHSAVSNAPPADVGRLVAGETNLYAGELWLMAFGGYSVEVSVRGKSGEGAVEIPVNSVALHQMPMPPALGIILTVLGVLLLAGGVAIVAGAARDSVLDPGVPVDAAARRKGRIAGIVTAVILVLVLVFGKRWWRKDEGVFRQQMHAMDPPKISATVDVDGARRILHLQLAKSELDWTNFPRLLPDHGKLAHLFLVREETRNAFAHLHPIRKGGRTFEVTLPPVPAGRYDLFCDLTFEKTGLSTTATNVIEIPPAKFEKVSFQPDSDSDLDDSWTVSSAKSQSEATTDPVFDLPDGGRVIWHRQTALRARHDAGLQFEIRDASGKPAQLEPYMGMPAHAAVMRLDGTVFAHLHPAGNYSMAAQDFYQSKLARENVVCPPGSTMEISGSTPNIRVLTEQASMISLPYEFPQPGDYRIWVQFKIGGKVKTAVFDAKVGE